MPRCRQAARNAAETNTLPWSITMGVRDDHGPGGGVLQPCVDVQQPLIGQHRVPSPALRASPARIGSGVSARASRTLASAALVDGRSTAAGTTLVATSIMPVSSARAGTPSSSSPRVARARSRMYQSSVLGDERARDAGGPRIYAKGVAWSDDERTRCPNCPNAASCGRCTGPPLIPANRMLGRHLVSRRPGSGSGPTTAGTGVADVEQRRRPGTLVQQRPSDSS
jgi:hypothetical protein